MIHNISLQNFKCFKDKTKFPISKLNLLTGINGKGKSSFLQSILLFFQSAERGGIDKLYLNGSCVELGNIDDLKNSETPKNKDIVVSFEYSRISKSIEYEDVISTEFHLAEDISDDFILLISKIIQKPSSATISLDSNIFPFDNVHYIAADRLGPLRYHDKINFGSFVTAGSKGQFTINVLAKLGDEPINDDLYLGSDANTVLQQTEEWLNFIFDGAKITIKGKERESSVYYILYNTKSTKYRFKPSNIGFGYSYILPVIVSGLIAKRNEILIVENPEAHLHPRAQSRITEFLAKVASCGVQVFIESHSEHVLNGIRIAALRDDINIEPIDTSIMYFQEDSDNPFIKLNLLNDGSIDNWMDGFFDQEEIDLAQIFKLNRKK